MHARVSFTISGAQTLKLTKSTVLNIYEIFGSHVARATYFLSVSAGEPLTLPNGMQLLYDIADLSPGIYEGPGTYTLKTGDSRLAHGVLNSASYLQFATTAGYFRKYSKFAEPCTFVVTAQQRHGELTCPRLASDDGSFVKAKIVWDLT